MSDETKTAEAGPQVGDVLFQKVYLPAFMKAAAERGIVPTNDAELHDMLKIAAMLRLQESAAVEEQAAQTAGVLHKAAAVLETATFGEASNEKQAEALDAIANDPEVKQALAQLAAGEAAPEAANA